MKFDWYKVGGSELDVLILSDPLLDVGHFNVSGIGKSGWVLIVGRSEVSVVRAALDIESNTRAIGSHVLVETTCAPWIKLSIRENGVGYSQEVLLVVEAAEVTQSPVIVWSQSISILAHLGVAIEVKLLCNEHGVRAHSNWHGKLVASQDVPAVAI